MAQKYGVEIWRRNIAWKYSVEIWCRNMAWKYSVEIWRGNMAWKYTWKWLMELAHRIEVAHIADLQRDQRTS
jgi:hypothetical protein